MSVRNAGEPTRRRRSSATPAVPAGTEIRPKAGGPPPPLIPVTSSDTPRSVGSGSTPGKNAPVNGSPLFETSDAPSKPSTRTWRQPNNVREFASQTNLVATLVLRGEIDLERARVYSGLARTVAQAMSTEVSRSRFLAQEPDLSLEGVDD